jgi:hypothetical protein
MKEIKYEAIVKINDEVVGKIEAHSLESLEEKIYSLKRRANSIIEEENIIIEDENEDTI